MTTDHRPKLTCNNILTKIIQLSSQLELENDTTVGKSLHWRSDHPSIRKPIKSIVKVSTEEKSEPKRCIEKYFPPSFKKFKEGD